MFSTTSASFAPGRVMPEFLGQFTGQGYVAGLAEADPAAGQEPVIQAVNRAQQTWSPRKMTAATRRLNVPAGPPNEMSLHWSILVAALVGG